MTERERERERQTDRQRYRGGENMTFLPSVVPKCELPVQMSKSINNKDVPFSTSP